MTEAYVPLGTSFDNSHDDNHGDEQHERYVPNTSKLTVKRPDELSSTSFKKSPAVAFLKASLPERIYNHVL